jgi:hypothetical protein
MKKLRFNALRFSVGIAIFACLGGIAALFILVAKDFGFGRTAFLSLFFLLPLFVTTRIYRRQPSACWRELAYLAVLFCFMCGCVAAFVQTLYAHGADEHQRWATLQRRIGNDPAFNQVEIERLKQGTYLARGSLATPTDRDHLVHLAGECGVQDSRLYGMFLQSVMGLKVEQPEQIER